MSHICPRYVPDISQISQNNPNAQVMAQIGPIYVPDMSLLCPRCVPEMSQIFPRNVPYMSYIYPRYVFSLEKDGMTWTSPEAGQSNISVSPGLQTTYQPTNHPNIMPLQICQSFDRRGALGKSGDWP